MDQDFDARQLEIQRKRKLAETLLANPQSLKGQMAGRFYVPASPIQGVSNLVGDYLGGKSANDAATDEKSLATDKRKALADVLSRARSSEDPSSVLMENPETMQTGFTIALDDRKRKAAADEKKIELQMQSDNRRQERQESDQRSADLRKELSERDAALRRELSATNNAARRGKNGAMPANALKMQQEELDSIGTASSINADLGALHNQLSTGKLELGPVSNLIGSAKNTLGMSDEKSRNLLSFKSTLEKLRNDSLRLNKGVQTEGDAQRAWNEIVSNINDKEFVKQRILEVQKINERAAALRKMNVDVIRGNYNLDPMDTQPYSNQQPALGGGPAKVTSDAEYDALPSGTTFIDPNGKTRRKP